MKKVLYFLLLLIPLSSIGQQQELKAYLTALKTPEFAESKKVIKELTFRNFDYYTLSSFSEVSGTMFTTDKSGIKGYKGIFTAKVLNKAGTFIEKRLMTVMYFDKISKKWKILDIREPADAEYEANTSQSNIDKGDFYTEKRFVYRSLCYWLMMSGKIIKAKEAVKLAIDNAKDDPLFNISYNDIIKRIE